MENTHGDHLKDASRESAQWGTGKSAVRKRGGQQPNSTESSDGDKTRQWLPEDVPSEGHYTAGQDTHFK